MDNDQDPKKRKTDDKTDVVGEIKGFIGWDYMFPTKYQPSQQTVLLRGDSVDIVLEGRKLALDLTSIDKRLYIGAFIPRVVIEAMQGFVEIQFSASDIVYMRISNMTVVSKPHLKRDRYDAFGITKPVDPFY